MTKNTPVSYEDFGAVGDGKTDDLEAIVKTHAHANQHGIPVRANDGASYYIGGKALTAEIQTDTDFGKAKFIIDDRKLEDRRSSVFKVTSRLKEFELEKLANLNKNQQKIKASLPGPCMIKVVNSHVKQYIRKGLNQNSGKSQQDVFLVDKDGNVDMNAPIIWDFDDITETKVMPIDPERLTIKGGHFTTIANQAESKYNYHSRNISVRRSNVEIVGLQHYVKEEGAHGAPYSGFVNITDCSDVTVRDSIFTGHKTYRTVGSAGRPVSMGTYDIQAGRAINISFINCTQSNDIKDGRFWGIMASNYSKNLTYDGCKLSRFDAHMGVCNAAIRNSTIGHAGINAIGHGALTLENTTVYGRGLIQMRPDYGSTWDGEFIVRDCKFIPSCGRSAKASLITGHNDGMHDFGYVCHLPDKISIENLNIDDSNHPDNYDGPAVFADFNSKLRNKSYVEKFPVVRPKKVILKNVTTASGKELRLSDNPFMFKNTKIETIDATK